MSDKVQ